MNSDLLEEVGIPWCFREDSAEMARRGKAFVINLDNKGNAGTHWTAARFVNGTLYYADPFGTIMNGWPPKELEKISNKKIINRISFQRPSTKLCGYYAMLFAMGMDTIGNKDLSTKEFESLLLKSIT